MATTEDRSEARKVYKDHNLHVLFGVTLMAVLGVSSITPALPEIRDVFGVTSAGFMLEERIAPRKGGNSNNKNCCPTGIDQGCCGGGSIY